MYVRCYFECSRLLEPHSSASVANKISHSEQNQTAVNYSIQFLIRQKLAVAVFVRNLQIDARRQSEVACLYNIEDVVIHSKMRVQCRAQILSIPCLKGL